MTHQVELVDAHLPQRAAARARVARTAGTALAAYGIVLALIMVLSVWSILGLRSAERAG